MRQRDIGAAFAVWQGMTIDPSDAYATTCSKILMVLQAAGTGTGIQSIDRREIDRILTAEHGRWISFSFDRLREFGYRFDSY